MFYRSLVVTVQRALGQSSRLSRCHAGTGQLHSRVLDQFSPARSLFTLRALCGRVGSHAAPRSRSPPGPGQVTTAPRSSEAAPCDPPGTESLSAVPVGSNAPPPLSVAITGNKIRHRLAHRRELMCPSCDRTLVAQRPPPPSDAPPRTAPPPATVGSVVRYR